MLDLQRFGPGRATGRDTAMLDRSRYGEYAEERADLAAGRAGEEERTDAIGEGLAAIALALLDVAAAIRNHAEETTRNNRR